MHLSPTVFTLLACFHRLHTSAAHPGRRKLWHGYCIPIALHATPQCSVVLLSHSLLRNNCISQYFTLVPQRAQRSATSHQHFHGISPFHGTSRTDLSIANVPHPRLPPPSCVPLPHPRRQCVVQWSRRAACPPSMGVWVRPRGRRVAAAGDTAPPPLPRDEREPALSTASPCEFR